MDAAETAYLQRQADTAQAIIALQNLDARTGPRARARHKHPERRMNRATANQILRTCRRLGIRPIEAQVEMIIDAFQEARRCS